MSQWFSRPGSNLVTIAKETGYPVKAVRGWETRGHGGMANTVKPIVCHHTAGPEPERTASNYPSFYVVRDGRAGLPGPLAQYGIGFDGTIYVFAAGLCYHAGTGSWRGWSGNSVAIGIEAEDGGDGDWLPAQLDVYPRLCAVICQFLGVGAEWVCFPSEVTILCRDGLKSIADVRVGDEVWTHKHRWRPVTSVRDREAETVILRGQGHPGLITTAEHPFLSAITDRGRVVGRPGGNYRRVHGTEWVDAQDMAGRHWATPLTFGDDEPIPLIPELPRCRPVKISPELFWVLGRWAADGSADHAKVSIYGGPGEAATIEEHCQAAGLECKTFPGATATRTNINSTALVAWFKEHFGHRAEGKTIPPWLLAAHPKYRTQFLNGYLSGDGHWMNEGRNEACTVSKNLAIGVKLLAQSLGWSTTLYYEHRNAGTIQGRAVKQLPRWRLRITRYPSERQQYFEHADYNFGRVRSVTFGDVSRVYNISVAEDESFVADSIVVHNCGHKEWTSRKIDPAGINMSNFRDKVDRYLKNPSTIRKGSTPPPEEDDMPTAKEVVDELLSRKIGDPFQVDEDGNRKPVSISVSIAWRLGRIPHIYTQNEALQRAVKANSSALAALAKLVSEEDGSELVAAARELTEAADRLANLPLATALIYQEEAADEEAQA